MSSQLRSVTTFTFVVVTEVTNRILNVTHYLNLSGNLPVIHIIKGDLLFDQNMLVYKYVNKLT